MLVVVASAWAGDWPDDMAPPQFSVAPPFAEINSAYSLADLFKKVLEAVKEIDDLRNSGMDTEDLEKALQEKLNELLGDNKYYSIQDLERLLQERMDEMLRSGSLHWSLIDKVKKMIEDVSRDINEAARGKRDRRFRRGRDSDQPLHPPGIKDAIREVLREQIRKQLVEQIKQHLSKQIIEQINEAFREGRLEEELDELVGDKQTAEMKDKLVKLIEEGNIFPAPLATTFGLSDMLQDFIIEQVKSKVFEMIKDKVGKEIMDRLGGEECFMSLIKAIKSQLGDDIFETATTKLLEALKDMDMNPFEK